MKKECIAMLLAGGQGSRLYALTKDVAKPAVPFGGKYRIIDFPLSNCINSGIDTVGVLTQYSPLELNDYIGDGTPWDLDRQNGGVHILPPYQSNTGSVWYLGTANAIYQNIRFIERYEPEYVLILSGDHIYRMNYDDMLRQHKKTGADCTIAVIDVPLAEASRFGIMNIKPDGSVYEFEEKPARPKSTLASMGIYIFTWEKLRAYLEADAARETTHDFGKNIIPDMLGDGCHLHTYLFEGYWKDVGTITSLWDSNMDLIADKVPFDLWDDSWRIYSRNPNMPPQLVGAHAEIDDSVISEGSVINGRVSFSVLFPDVLVEEGAEVVGSILMPGTVVRSGARVQYAILAENVTVESGASVGSAPGGDGWSVAVIGQNVRVKEGESIPPAAMIYGERR